MTPIRIAVVALSLALSTPAGQGPVGQAPVALPNPSVLGPRGTAGFLGGFGYGTYAWPVRGPVIRGFEPPPDPFGQGHRGIDIAAPFGTGMVAAADGVVAFAGWVAGSLFISIDHPDGVRTTYSWLSEVDVRKGGQVSKNEVIGRTGHGHPGLATPHLHFGARVGSAYVDPMLLLERGSVVGLIHLAPLAGSAAPGYRPPSYNERPWLTPSPPRLGPSGFDAPVTMSRGYRPADPDGALAPGSGHLRLPGRSWRASPQGSGHRRPPPSRPPPGRPSRVAPLTLAWRRRAPLSPG